MHYVRDKQGLHLMSTDLSECKHVHVLKFKVKISKT